MLSWLLFPMDILSFFANQHVLHVLEFNSKFNLIGEKNLIQFYLQSDFKHLKDYVTYIWAKEHAEDIPEGVEVTFWSRYLPEGSGTYRLAYISTYKDTLLGLSEEFQVYLCVLARTKSFPYVGWYALIMLSMSKIEVRFNGFFRLLPDECQRVHNVIMAATRGRTPPTWTGSPGEKTLTQLQLLCYYTCIQYSIKTTLLWD